MSNTSHEITDRQRHDIDQRISQDTEIREIVRDMHERMIEELNEPLSVRLAREKELEKLIEKPAPSRFKDVHFTKACRVLRALRKPTRNIKRPLFDHDVERVLTYELTICVIKYTVVLNEALDAALFFKKFPAANKIERDEVLTVAYDLLERGFKIDLDLPKLAGRFGTIQDNLMSLRTKIMAHLARLRIKNEAINIEGLLPEKLRHQSHVDQNPLYAWVNLAKSTVEAMVLSLIELKLKRSLIEDDILIQEESFYLDEFHGNLIRFHSSRFEFLRTSELIRGSYLVMQDKSDCLQVYTLIKALFFKEFLIRGRHKINGTMDPLSLNIHQQSEPGSPADDLSDKWYDGILEDNTNPQESQTDSIIVTHCGSGFTVAHLAVQLRSSVPQWLSKNTEMSTKEDLVTSIANKFLRRPTINVIAFGVPSHKVEEITYFLRRRVGISNIHLYQEDFVDVSPDDSRVRGAIAILVNPPSSGSALKDPVKYLCSEGGDEEVLTQMSKYICHQTSNTNNESKYYKPDQSKFLQHALEFPKIKLVMYTTCSILPSENKDVVDSAIGYANFEMESQRSISLAEALYRKHIHSYTDVSYDFVDMAQILDDYPTYLFTGPFLDMYPNSASSGGFIALIRRKEKQMNIQRSTMSSPSLSSNGSNTHETFIQQPGPAMTSKSAVTGNVVTQRFTQQELAVYLKSQSIGLKNPSIDIVQQPIKHNHHNNITVVPQQPIQQPDQPNQPKRKIGTKKAILQRISIPTHSSLAKRKEKFARPTPMGELPRPPKRLTMPNGPCIAPTNTATPCVCVRHAKKFPEFRTKIIDVKK